MHEDTEKIHLFTDFSYLWLMSNGFCVLFIILHHFNCIFLPNVIVSWLRIVNKVNYSIKIPKGVLHPLEHFLERHKKRSYLKSNMFKWASNKMYLFVESILYPYINTDEGSGEHLSLSMQDYTDILHFIETMGFHL